MTQSVREACRRVAELLGLDPMAVLSKSRQRSLARARFVAYLYCYDVLQLGYKEIGNAMLVDHTAIIHGVSVARKLMTSTLWNGVFKKMLKKGKK